MKPTIYDITLSNGEDQFTISDIWITANEGGLDRAISEAIYLSKDSLNIEGDIKYISHECL